jgi:hypothetical protein
MVTEPVQVPMGLEPTSQPPCFTTVFIIPYNTMCYKIVGFYVTLCYTKTPVL